MKRRRKYPDWVVVSEGMRIGAGEVGEIGHCKRCGEKLVLGLPLRLEAFADMLVGFSQAHSTCVEREAKRAESGGQ